MDSDTFRRFCPLWPSARSAGISEPKEFSHFNFFCLSGPSPRMSLLGSFCNFAYRGRTRARKQEHKTRCSQLRAHNRVLHKHHQSLSEKIAPRAPCRCPWRSSQPPARVLPCMIVHLFSPRRPRSTFAEITTCRYHLPTSIARHMDNTTYYCITCPR